MKPNAGPADSVRAEIPLAFCPNTDPEKGTRGADNCCPAAEGGGWKPDGTVLPPTAWRNGALIKQIGSKWYKMMWGAQFGFGVYSPKAWPNGTALPSNDPGCPTGCLFELLSDPTESNDLAKTAEGKPILAQLIQRQQAIGLTVYQVIYIHTHKNPSRCVVLIP